MICICSILLFYDEIYFYVYCIYGYVIQYLFIFYLEYSQSSFFGLYKMSSVKKINGYKIMMDNMLGTGSYGTVYRGEQDGTKLPCAIKIVQKKLICQDPYLKAALDSQIQIMSKLKSTNIVGFFDVLMSSHNYYIVQQLCQTDLEHYLRENCGKIKQQLAIKFLTEICNGFITLIREGIVHRDLKPANILINKGVLKIGDFGFAKANVHRKIKNQSCVGTPLYMSLQVLKSMGYTSKCDIWSIGCIFYQILHGCTPWKAKSQYQLILNIQNIPITISNSLSQNTKDFLTRTLKICQEDRICWDDIFKHPIFNGYFKQYTNQNIQLENTYKKVMSDLRFKVNSQNIDLQSIWKSLGFQQNIAINFQQFQTFLDIINPNMIKWEKLYFFQKLDPNGKGSISLSHLSDQLEKNSISTSSRQKKKIPLGLKKINTISLKQMDQIDQSSQRSCWDQNFEKRVRACFQRLHKIIVSKGLTLYKTLIVYDKDSNGKLKIDQFSKILKKLDPTFTHEQIQAVFDLIDVNNSKTIEFKEFNTYFCKINGIPANMSNITKVSKQN